MSPQLQTFSLFFLVALASLQLSTGHDIQGSVTCLDCDGHTDLSGIKVLVKCSKVKKTVVATTEKDGTFAADLPKDHSSSESLSCLSKILGGPTLIYSSGKRTISNIAKVKGQDFYTNIQPLNFYQSCPDDKHALCASVDVEFSSSETVDIPLPREWGLAPSSYYVPFIPIIGIP